jgi:protein TonB
MAVKLDDRSRGGARKPFAPPERRPGDTLPPTPLANLLATGGADLLVLSADAQLIDTVTRANREQLPLWAVGSWSELETALGVSRRAVVLLDAELLGDATSARIAALDAYSHKAVTLVAADRPAAEGLMGLLSERKIHRLLIKPPALGITRLLIDSAVGRCLKLAEVEEPEPPTIAEQPRAPRRRRAGAPLWVFAAAGAAIIAGVAVIASVSALWRSSDEGVPASSEVAPPEMAIAAIEPERPEAEDLAARDARDDGPAPQTLDDYLAVAAADPTDAAARQQLDALVAAAYAEAERALLAGERHAAAAALADVRRVDPTSTRLAFLEKQIASAGRTPARPAAAEPPAPVAAANTELASLVTIARARIQRSQLLEPSGDSALEYVNRAARLAPQDAEVAAARGELAAALVAGARSALARADLGRASALVREAARTEAPPHEVAQLESDLAQLRAQRAAQRHAEWLALATARLEQGALVAPADDSARDYLVRLQDEAPRHAGLAAAWTKFVAALEDRISAAVAARDWARAEEGLAALADAPGGAGVGESLRERLALGKLEERYLAVAAPAGELELLERAAPVYPADAARDGVEGWVDVEFVVDVTGRPGDFEVVAAEPEGRFEQAALAALAKYRYRPFAQDGRLFARRLRLRIRFTLE